MQVHAGLVGRELEQEQLAALVAGELPAALLLCGEAGIGKTALWRDGVRAGEAAGFRVLSARPAEREGTLSFAALGDLLAGIELPATLPAPQRRALEAALLLAEPERTAANVRTLGSATLAVLRALAAERPLLVAVDDVQWVDSASAEALSFAVRRLRDEPVALLLARRADETTRLELDGSALPVHELEVGPLSLGAVQRLLRVRLDSTLSRPQLRHVHEASGGNPLYALELARSGGAGVPSSLADLVGERLAALPEETQAALLELAALRETAARDLDPATLAPALEAGVVEPDGEELLRFAHPLFAAAVYERADPWRRRELHGRLARTAPSREERARHLALAADPPDAAVAAALEDAAEDALRRGAPAAAAELLEQALRFTAGDEEAVARRSIAAADAANRAGDGERARALAEAAYERLQVGAARASVAVWLADAIRSREVAERAVREAGDDPRLRPRALNALAETLLQEGDARGALASARAAADAPRAGGDPATLVRALSHAGFLAAMSGDPSGAETLGSAIEVERELGEEQLFFSPAVALAVTRIWADDLAAARPTLERQVEAAAAAGDDWVRAALLFHLVKVDVREGRWAEAQARVDEILELRASGGWPERSSELWAAGAVAAHVGALDEARELGRAALETSESVGDGLFTAYARSLLGFVELSVGDAEAAAGHLEPLPALLAASGILDPGFLAASADELEALVGCGRLDDAECRIAEVEARGLELGRPRELVAAGRARGLLLAARGETDAAVAELERVLPLHDDLDVPFARGRTLLALGSLLRRARRHTEARAALEDACAVFARLGASAWLARAEDELGMIGGRAAADGLTPAERRVAELAAAGRTTKEIAAALVVSPKTVEKHLTSLYAKLGVRSRAELAGRFDA